MFTQIKEEKFLEMLYGFRGTCLLLSLLREDEHAEDSFIMNEIENYCGLNSADIVKMLRKFKHTMRHVDYDYKHIWHPRTVINQEKVIGETHDIDVEAYVKHMEEWHKISEFNLDPLEDILRGSDVLDVGCGSMFFRKLFMNKKIKTYLGIDRAAVFTHVKGNFNFVIGNIEGILVEDIGKFDVIWVSEVIHSKPDPISFLKSLTRFLYKDGVIIVNETMHGTLRSKGFDTQLLLHTGARESIRKFSTHDWDKENDFIYENKTVISKYHCATVLRLISQPPLSEDLKREFPDFFVPRTKKRPNLEETFMKMAETLALRSTCQRESGQHGCLIVSRDSREIYGFGYNGNVAGGENACQVKDAEPGGCLCTHAEINALTKASILDPAIMYCTASPCVPCAKAIVNSNKIEIFIFKEFYRDIEGINVLRGGNISVNQLKEDGNLVYQSKDYKDHV